MRQRVLADALDLPHEQGLIVAWRDQATGLSHLRRATDFHTYGLELELHAYQRAVLLDWHILRPTDDAPWDALCDSLAGRGVNNLDEAIGRMRLRPLHEALAHALSRESLHKLVQLASAPPSETRTDLASLLRSVNKLARMIEPELPEAMVAAAMTEVSDSPAISASKKAAEANDANMDEPELRLLLQGATRLPALSQHFSDAWPSAVRTLLPTAATQSLEVAWAPLLAWLLLDSLLPRSASRPWLAAQSFDDLYLRPALAEHLRSLGMETQQTWQTAARIRILLRWSGSHPLADPAVWPAFFEDAEVAWLTGLHTHEGVEYLVLEGLDAMLCWLTLPELMRIAALPAASSMQALSTLEAEIVRIRQAAADSGYRLDKLLRLLNPTAVDAEESAVVATAQDDGRNSDPSDPEPVTDAVESTAPGEPESVVPSPNPDEEPS